MDKKRLNAEEVPEITQGDIDAWNRGKDDAARNKLLKVTQKLSPERAVALVKMYAALGDIHYLSTRFDISPEEARRILVAFGVNSIEDAKAAVRDGIIAEYDDAAAQNRETRALEQAVDHAAAEERLTELENAKVVEEKTVEEQDIALAKRRDEAQRKNKEDQLRQLIAEGIDPDTGVSAFRIPLNLIAEFKVLIPHGVSQLQRRFGGSAKDIVNEVKRLAPDVDTNMLRP
ncbi:MAG: hypothetical protein ACXABY_01885 [Candidatus Thorarchaeota archaeon]|jgi:hypothetical protein